MPPELKPVKSVSYGQRPDSLVVACVWWGDKYPIEYVYKLHAAVRRNLTIPFRFACLTDKAVNARGIETYRTKHDWPGWWQKIGLFEPGLFVKRRVLYFDLDVVICLNIDNLACVSDPFACVENFSPNRQRSAHNSSIMVWDSDGIAQSIFRDFQPEVMDRLHGDQCYIWRTLDSHGYDIPNFSRADVQSYKYDTLRGKADAQCIVFHGKPDPHEVQHPEVERNWTL